MAELTVVNIAPQTRAQLKEFVVVTPPQLFTPTRIITCLIETHSPWRSRRNIKSTAVHWVRCWREIAVRRSPWERRSAVHPWRSDTWCPWWTWCRTERWETHASVGSRRTKIGVAEAGRRVLAGHRRIDTETRRHGRTSVPSSHRCGRVTACER